MGGRLRQGSWNAVVGSVVGSKGSGNACDSQSMQSRNASRLASLTGNQALSSASVPLSKTNMYISVCLCFLSCVRTDSWHAVALARLVWPDGRRETSTNPAAKFSTRIGRNCLYC